ncbi:hypothetical protein SNE40_023326 [Patella caerulea]|uniref:Uncharacterized protein n=1 Tax=Patella caerulea TaxID=87958 RepID=A0AAN8G658_PATCE
MNVSSAGVGDKGRDNAIKNRWNFPLFWGLKVVKNEFPRYHETPLGSLVPKWLQHVKGNRFFKLGYH